MGKWRFSQCGNLKQSYDEELTLFGTDFNDVDNANSSSHPNVDYENLDVNSFQPGPLQSSTTYYWRITFWDDSGSEGTASATQNFTTGSLSSCSSAVLNA